MIIRGQAGFNQGFVGIGNGFVNPQSLLHIHDGGLSYLQVTNIASGSGLLNGVRFGLQANTSNAVVAQQNASNLYFITDGPAGTNAGTRISIVGTNTFNKGFVGIGTSYINPNNLLDVNGGDIDVNTPQRSYMIGDQSVLWHKGGISNLFLGVGAGQNHSFNVSVDNLLIGNDAGFNVIGAANVNANVIIGSRAGYLYNNEKSTIIGTEAGYNTNAGHVTLVGYRAGYNFNPATGLSGNTFVGFESGYSNNQSANDNAFFGNLSGRNNTTGDQNSFFGNVAGRNSTAGTSNSFFGNACGENNATFSANNYYGHLAGNTSTGDNNVFVGNSTGAQGVGNRNVIIGNNGMQNATTGSNDNVSVGYQTGLNSNTNSFNTTMGSQSAPNISNSRLNTMIGYQTAFNQTGGVSNAYLGENTGVNIVNGDNNTFVGAKADATNANSNLTNAAAIGANAKVTNSNHMILGDNNVNVGIGLSSDPIGPGNKLEINSGTANTSGLRFSQLTSVSPTIPNPGLGVLAVDANGDVIYVPDNTSGNFGNVCGAATQNPLTNDWEIPLGNPIAYNYHFTGQDLAKHKVSVGFPCGTFLRGRFNSYQNAGTIHGQETISGYFLNSDTNGQSQDTLVGVFGEANGIPPSSADNVNLGGSFYAMHARFNVGVQGIAQNTTAQPNQPAVNYGGRFIGRNAITNYGIWAGAGGSGFAGYFQGDVFVNGGANSGTGFLVASDQMFKTGIDTINNAMGLLNQLKPKTYYFDTTNIYGIKFNSAKQYGLIAQDVQAIMPELVNNITKPAEYDSLGNIISPSVTYKNLNYNALFALLIKGAQIQQVQIEKQDSIIQAMQSQLSALTSSVSSCCSNSSVRTTKPEEVNQLNIDLSDKDIIVLNQNVPNPFAEQTTITYNVPEKYGYAQIIFSTIEGKIIKAVDITKKGRGQLNVFASDLSSGMYTYSLVVDGKTIDTKKMVKSE